MGTRPRSAGGLSPPTRGSQRKDRTMKRLRGSIPAHTGKPASPGWWKLGTTVYPRPHGEALRRGAPRTASGGLSPPTRGSPGYCPPRVNPEGSIPAHTGKPAGGRYGDSGAGVYPRPHGEAGILRVLYWPARGLSPPTRGSLAVGDGRDVKLGSIPAHTGKPRRTPGGPPRSWVYPRPHGEAPVCPGDVFPAGGLSPPTRGSLVTAALSRARSGSIPAHTGKPAGP